MSNLTPFRAWKTQKEIAMDWLKYITPIIGTNVRITENDARSELVVYVYDSPYKLIENKLNDYICMVIYYNSSEAFIPAKAASYKLTNQSDMDALIEFLRTECRINPLAEFIRTVSIDLSANEVAEELQILRAKYDL